MIVVDVETSGMSPSKNCILSIGAVDFNFSQNQFYGECQAEKGKAVSMEALKINGFTFKEIRDKNKQTLEELLKEFYRWMMLIPDRTFAGQNVDFDRNFINFAFRQYKIPLMIEKRIIDLHSVCFAYMLKNNKTPLVNKGFSALNTDRILKYVGLKEREGAHNALEDAKLEAEAFGRLIYGKNIFPEYVSYSFRV